MSFAPQIDEAVRQSVRIFEGMGIRYAIGGAVAMAFDGYLRGTRDVDMAGGTVRWGASRTRRPGVP